MKAQNPSPVRAQKLKAGVLVVAAAAAAAFIGYEWAQWPPEPPTAERLTVASGDPSEAPSPTDEAETSVAVVGDRFSVAPRPGAEAWPDVLGDELGWDVTVDAVTGAGWTTGRAGERVGARVEQALASEPTVLVVAAGFTDVVAASPRAVATEIRDVFGDLDTSATSVVLLSPFSDGEPGPLTRQMTEAMAGAAEEVGVAFVDVTSFLPERPQLLGPNGTYPSAQGHELLADQIAEALVETGAVEATSA